MRRYQQPSSLFMLTGMAVRMGQRIGLHRDGSEVGLSPFETEIRRRVWSMLVNVDAQTAHLCGARTSWSPPISDNKALLNVNDGDLDPNMSTLPDEHHGPTEMIFVKFRVEISRFFRSMRAFEIQHVDNKPNLNHTEAQIAHTNTFETFLHENYGRYCDPQIPLHRFLLMMTEGTILIARMMAYHPRHHRQLIPSSCYSGIPLSIRDPLFTTSCQLIESYSQAMHTESIQKFLWYFNVHFQWHGFVILLNELCVRTSGDDATRGWRLIDSFLECNMDVITNTGTPLYKAVEEILSKAWAARESALTRNYSCRTNPRQQLGTTNIKQGDSITTPRCIQIIRNQSTTSTAQSSSTTMSEREVNDRTLTPRAVSPQLVASSDIVSVGDGETSGFDINATSKTGNEIPSESTPIDWAQWDSLLYEFDYGTGMFMSAKGDETY